MDFIKVRDHILQAIKRFSYDPEVFEEYFTLIREYVKEDFETGHRWNHELQDMVKPLLRECAMREMFVEAQRFDDLLYQVLLLGSRDFFDDYMQAVEYGKPVDKQFYRPRRHYLKRYVDAYQEIIDGNWTFCRFLCQNGAGKVKWVSTLR